MKPTYPQCDFYHLVRVLQGDRLNVLPVGIEYTHGVSAFLSTIYGLKGAVETSVSGCLVQFTPTGSRLLGCPFLYFWTPTTNKTVN